MLKYLQMTHDVRPRLLTREKFINKYARLLLRRFNFFREPAYVCDDSFDCEFVTVAYFHHDMQQMNNFKALWRRRHAANE